MTRPTSLLLLYTDQWRWDAIGSVRGEVHTPVLDELAGQGVHFDHAFVQSPVSMPSRVSTLTGRTPSDLGVTHMGVPVPTDMVTLATILSGHGYRTANVGKLHFLPHANRDHADVHPAYGFDTMIVSEEPGVYDDAYRAWIAARDPQAVSALSVGLPPAAAVWREIMGFADLVPHPGGGPRNDYDAPLQPFPLDKDLTHTAFVADRTRQVLRSYRSAEPFLCIASFFSPHPPWSVPSPFLDLYDTDALPLPELTAADETKLADAGISHRDLREIRHAYYASISEIDHHVGTILDELSRSNRAEDTIVVLLSDHGEWLGDHGRFAKGHPADDPVSRVPLLMRWPAGIVGPGRRESDLVELLDLVPTLLDALGIPTPAVMAGRSLVPVLKAGTVAPIAGALVEHHGWRSLRTLTHHYVIHADGTEALWDLENDPHEHRDIAANPDSAAALAQHRHHLLTRLLVNERPTPRTWPY